MGASKSVSSLAVAARYRGLRKDGLGENAEAALVAARRMSAVPKRAIVLMVVIASCWY